jgi:hypothetical protein
LRYLTQLDEVIDQQSHHTHARSIGEASRRRLLKRYSATARLLQSRAAPAEGPPSGRPAG